MYMNEIKGGLHEEKKKDRWKERREGRRHEKAIYGETCLRVLFETLNGGLIAEQI